MMQVIRSTSVNGAEHPVGLATGAATDQVRRLENLAPLIHQLIAWGLVYRSDDGDYVLIEEVKRRLGEMSSLEPPVAQVYVGRACESCNAISLTRLIDGSRLCATCSTTSTGSSSVR